MCVGSKKHMLDKGDCSDFAIEMTWDRARVVHT